MASTKDNVFVVLSLSGGNDGLNTVVPFGDANYYKARPRLGIRERDVLKAADGFGFHPSMVGFERLHKFVKAIEERCNPQADFPAVLKHEEKISPALGGRSVFD